MSDKISAGLLLALVVSREYEYPSTPEMQMYKAGSARGTRCRPRMGGGANEFHRPQVTGRSIREVRNASASQALRQNSNDPPLKQVTHAKIRRTGRNYQ